MSPDEKKDLEKDLNRFMKLHAFKSVEDLIKIPGNLLIEMDGFGYRLLNFLQDEYGYR